MRGPKHKPTLLKQIDGNPGKRKLPTREPKPPGDLVDPPGWFSESQRESWAYAIAHSPQGLLRRIDRGALAVWVVAEDLHRQATVAQNTFGQLLVKGKSDGALPIQSPNLPIINRQALIMLKAAEQLGFTPAARPRIESGQPLPPDAPENKAHASEDPDVASKYLQ